MILAVIVLLFGAKKLPDLARGSGRALRIFKAETKGLVDGDDDDDRRDATGHPGDRPNELYRGPEGGSRPAGEPDSHRTHDS